MVKKGQTCWFWWLYEWLGLSGVVILCLQVRQRSFELIFTKKLIRVFRSELKHFLLVLVGWSFIMSLWFDSWLVRLLCLVLILLILKLKSNIFQLVKQLFESPFVSILTSWAGRASKKPCMHVVLESNLKDKQIWSLFILCSSWFFLLTSHYRNAKFFLRLVSYFFPFFLLFL